MHSLTRTSHRGSDGAGIEVERAVQLIHTKASVKKKKKNVAEVNHRYKLSCQSVFEIIGAQVASLRRLAVRHTYQSGIDRTLIYFLIN